MATTMSSDSLWQQALLLISVCLVLTACAGDSSDSALGKQGNTAATKETIRSNAKVRQLLDLDNQKEFEQARRGLIAAPQALQITGPDDTVIWDMPSYAFVQGAAPDTVNPSLWRQEILNNHHGLFKVTDGHLEFSFSNFS